VENQRVDLEIVAPFKRRQQVDSHALHAADLRQRPVFRGKAMCDEEQAQERLSDKVAWLECKI
jgi:hypothetical protein